MLKQTQIKGLLVIQLDDGGFAGAASQMNATAVKKGTGFEIGFNQSVGDMMTKATAEVDKFIRVRHAGKLPAKLRIDAYLLQGIKPLYQIQVFSLKTFEQASQLASLERPESVQKSLDEFALVQSALHKNKKYIYNGKVRAKLREIVKLTPNHLSARLLLLHSIKKAPKKLSLLESLSGIDNAGSKLLSMLEDGSFMKPGSLGDDVLTDLVYELSRLRPMLDKRTTRYADTYLDVANFFKRHRNRNRINAQLERELNTKARAIGVERKKLLNNPDIREELIAD